MSALTEEFLLKLNKCLEEHTVEGSDGHVLSKKECYLWSQYKIDGIKMYLNAVYNVLHTKELVPKTLRLKRLSSCKDTSCAAHFVRVSHAPTFETLLPGDYKYWTDYLACYSEKDGNCMLWNAGCTKAGYGKAKFLGRTMPAHRLAWQLHHRKTLDSKTVVRHRCTQRSVKCINVHHLDIGTAADNGKDNIIDGTSLKEEKNASCKITKERAIEIKNSVGEGTLSERATKYGVSKHLVYDIDRARCWRSLWSTAELKAIDNRPLVQAPKLSREVVRSIKRARRELTRKQCAEKFNCTIRQVQRIDSKESYADVDLDEDDNTYNERKRKAYYKEMQERIRGKCRIEKDETGEHWLWERYIDVNGYGQVTFYNRPRPVHLVSWIVFHDHPSDELGTDDDGNALVTRHKCRHRACCNPACLCIGTHQDNMNDMRIENAKKKQKTAQDLQEERPQKKQKTAAKQDLQEDSANKKEKTAADSENAQENRANKKEKTAPNRPKKKQKTA
jgi:hypothetical protein